ncbi:Uncharacterised protein [Chromobacterium violaceum]|uniref:Uncharacterized protein n=1 Tax=Chromobacterium violaceum TaxID=536 RepID=A0A447T4A6_CHRVL|nr:Uncharacterised protein [Chromobacterium violaceum]
MLALTAEQPLWRWLQSALALIPGSLLTLALLALAGPWLARRRRGALWVALIAGASFALCQWRLQDDWGRPGPRPRWRWRRRRCCCTTWRCASARCRRRWPKRG